MNNTKLVNVLRTLNKNELKDFEKFVSSPFFNKGRNYLPFLTELKRFYPKFEDKKMTPEYVFSRLYHGKKFNKQIIWNMNSALFNIAEEFMIYESLKTNTFTRKHLLAEAYYDRMLMQLFTKTIDEIEKIIEKSGMTEDYFHFKAQLVILRKAFIFLEDKQHLIPEYVIAKGDYSILHFLKSITGVILDMHSNAKMYNARFDTDLPHNFIRNFNFEEFINYARQKNYGYAWVIEMCYYSIMSVLDPASVKYYSELKKLMELHFNEFQTIEKNNWLTVLINYCLIRADEHGDYFRKELFELNKFQLRENIFPQARYLPKILFHQILRNALLIGETDWAKNFIEKYAPRLKPSHRKPMYALGNAYLNFSLGNYNEVIENLKNFKFIDSRDKLHVRNLYIRTYYELNEYEAVLFQIDSTRQFLSSNTATTAKTKASYIRSLNLLSRLVNAKADGDKDKLEEIKRKVTEERELIFGKWLLEKIEELE